MNFPDRCKIKKLLNNRLKADGAWDRYNVVRAHLKQAGIDEGIAWRAAAYPFAPANGSPAEILSDPSYAEIVANWQNGAYTMPDATAAPEESPGESKKTPAGPDQWRAEFQKLAAAVGDRTASEVEESRWVTANFLRDVREIDPESVPSAASLSILMWCQMSPSNFGDFLRTNHAKLLPSKTELEYESRFKDTGQDLKLLEEFEMSLVRERQSAEASSNGSTVACPS